MHPIYFQNTLFKYWAINRLCWHSVCKEWVTGRFHSGLWFGYTQYTNHLTHYIKASQIFLNILFKYWAIYRLCWPSVCKEWVTGRFHSGLWFGYPQYSNHLRNYIYASHMFLKRFISILSNLQIVLTYCVWRKSDWYISFRTLIWLSTIHKPSNTSIWTYHFICKHFI